MVETNYRLNNEKLEVVSELFEDAVLNRDLITAIRTNTLIHAELFERYQEAARLEKWANQFSGKEYDSIAIKTIRNRGRLRDRLISCEGAGRRLVWYYLFGNVMEEN